LASDFIVGGSGSSGSVVARRQAENPWAMTTTWFMGTNIPGKPRAPLVFLGGAPMYRQMCAQVVADAYRGFDLT
jgi:hypothetical protein